MSKRCEWREFTAEKDNDAARWLNAVEQDEGGTVEFVAMASLGGDYVLVVAKICKEEEEEK